MASETGSALDALDMAGLMRLLPHRYPFLLIDRIHSIDGDESAIDERTARTRHSLPMAACTAPR